MRQKSRLRGFAAILIALFILVGGAIIWVGIPYLANVEFGIPSPALTGFQRWSYGLQVLLKKGHLTVPIVNTSESFDFTIQPDESVTNVASRLETSKIISDASAFRSYLVYKGFDSLIKAGDYNLSPAMSAVEVASAIQTTYGPIVAFYIYPGWRAEEIAAALPTSGIEVKPEDFLKVVQNPVDLIGSSVVKDCQSAEGFLFPGDYEISRKISAEDLVLTFIKRFESNVEPEVQKAIKKQGLTLCEGVTLASIIQRETFKDDERAQITSVFYNRLANGIKLETDPTVQYALGFSSDWGNWWKTPLQLSDLGVNSTYNTYVIPGLPPAPISNPALPSIFAVAYSDDTPYFYFRAKCDASGYHNFSITFEEHLSKACK